MPRSTRRAVARMIFLVGCASLTLVLSWTCITLAQTYLLRRPIAGVSAGTALADLSTTQADQLEAIYDWLQAGAQTTQDCVYVEGPTPSHGVLQSFSCPGGYHIAASGGSWFRFQNPGYVGRVCTVASATSMNQYTESPVEHPNFKCSMMCCK